MFSAEQVVYALRQEEAGTAVEAVCRSPGGLRPVAQKCLLFPGSQPGSPIWLWYFYPSDPVVTP